MTPLTMLNVLFGIFGQSNDDFIVNHVILIAKYFIYKCKLSNAKPSLRFGFVAKVKTVYEIERQIARFTNINYKKWEKILPCVQQSA